MSCPVDHNLRFAEGRWRDAYGRFKPAPDMSECTCTSRKRQFFVFDMFATAVIALILFIAALCVTYAVGWWSVL